MTHSTEFKFEDGCYCFVGGDAPLQVPAEYVRRSAVLVHICEEAESEITAILAIDDACIRAWYRCTHVWLKAPDNLALRYTDEELGRAWKASDFLQDSETQQAIADVLSKILVPYRVRSSSLQKWIAMSPGEAQQDRACKMIKAIPAHCLLSLLESIQPRSRFDTKVRDHVMGEDLAILTYLLLLLPPSCHAAVLYTRCRSLATDGHLKVPCLPIHWTMDDTCHRRASLTMAMIAAACAFSEGNAMAIWNPLLDEDVPAWSQLPTRCFPTQQLHSNVTSKRSMQSALPGPAGDVTSAGRRQLRRVEAEGAHDEGLVIPVQSPTHVTKLSLDLTLWSPDLWCIGVQQLQTLRCLDVQANNLEHLSIRTGVFGSIPGLECVSVALVRRTKLRPKRMPPVVPSFVSSAVGQLLSALCAAPRLSSITLQGCFATRHADGAMQDAPAMKRLDLSSFTGLTKLSLRGCVILPQWLEFVTEHLLQLTGIVELDMSESVAGGAAAARARLQGGMPALEHVDLGQTDPEWLGDFPEHAVSNPLFQGVKWLSLKGACIGTALVPQLLNALQDLDLLECLSLYGNELYDSGVMAFAAIFHRLTCLKRVDVGNNSCTHVGAFAVLDAVAVVGEYGAPLRALGLASTEVAAEAMARFRARLMALTQLQELDVSECAHVMIGQWVEEVDKHLRGGLDQLTTLVAAGPSDWVHIKWSPLFSGFPNLREFVVNPADPTGVDFLVDTYVHLRPDVSVLVRPAGCLV